MVTDCRQMNYVIGTFSIKRAKIREETGTSFKKESKIPRLNKINRTPFPKFCP